jgi:BlaI family transcriptional regulator, penicillinase repressor
MARPAQDVTDAELAVLEVLWQRGPCSRRQIADVLYPGGQPAHYTTVQKLLERLEAKGCVALSAETSVRTFAAQVSRDQLMSRRLLELAEKLSGGSVAPLLMNLVRAKPLTDTELKELRNLVDELSRKNKRKGDRRS